jgi:hypothetical protein
MVKMLERKVEWDWRNGEEGRGAGGPSERTMAAEKQEGKIRLDWRRRWQAHILGSDCCRSREKGRRREMEMG